LHLGPVGGVGPVDDDRGKDLSAGGLWAAPAEGGGGVDGCRWGRVPKEDVKEQVLFASFFERGFNLPRETSSVACCTSTCWSWYILFSTPSL
jgi:hypothetical protein